MEFVKYMKPTTQELTVRQDTVNRFSKLVRHIDTVKVTSIRPVGSCVTGIFLPTSDIDMVVTYETAYTTSLTSIYYAIQRSGFASNIQNISQASTPLLRITDKKTGLEIDLTASAQHSIKATDAVKKWLKDDETGVTKALIMVLKVFLSIRKCGTTYTGGLNSYVLVWMVVAWVKLEWPKIFKKNSSGVDSISSLVDSLQRLSVKSPSSPAVTRRVTPDYGDALKGFLKFYGYDFDYYNKAIRIEPTPSYENKRYQYSRYTQQRYLLSIFDPADDAIDMGSKAYGIKHIQECFKEAYKTILKLEKLQELKAEHRVGPKGFLGTVLDGDFTKFVERREALRRCVS